MKPKILITTFSCERNNGAVTIQTRFQGAFVHKDKGQQQVIVSSPWERVRFGCIAFDTLDMWDAESHEFVIPSGVTYVRLTGQIVFSHRRRGALQALITRNGALTHGYGAQNGAAFCGTTPDMNVSSPPLKVSPGETFQLQAWSHKNRWSKWRKPAQIYGNGGTWFSIEVLG